MARDNKKQDKKDGGKKNPNQGGGSQDRHPAADMVGITASQYF